MEAYCRRRWGGSGWTHDVRSQGKKDGGATFQNWIWWPNTFKAHQFIKFLVEKKKVKESSVVHDVLCRAIYEEGKNVSGLNDLMEIAHGAAEELGLDDGEDVMGELRSYLEGDEGAEDVKMDIDRGRRMYRISGVPYFVIDREGRDGLPYGLSGAQRSGTLLDVFEELSSE